MNSRPTDATIQPWAGSLKTVRSRGQIAPAASCLADLHQRRKDTLGQFFTPDFIARFMWMLVAPAMGRFLDRHAGARIRILDPAIGSGRLIQFAQADRHTIYGLDVDESVLAPLGAALAGAEFDHELRCAGMEDLPARRFAHVALLNPPFSLPLESPDLVPGPSTHFGRFGPDTGSVSHLYAVDLALQCAGVVVALLPRSAVAWFDSGRYPRLQAIYDLPASAFAQEGANVATSVLVFASEPAVSEPSIEPAPFDQVPDLGLQLTPAKGRFPAYRGISDEGPMIVAPVTGDRTVRVCHDGRRIVLKFACGLTEAKVRNAVLRERIDAHRSDGEARHRYAPGVRYTGQGRLDVEVLLMQSDPWAAFESLKGIIFDAGGRPVVDPGLVGYLRRRIRCHAVDRCPSRHWIVSDGSESEELMLRPRRALKLLPNQWASPVVRPADVLPARRIDSDRVLVSAADQEIEVSQQRIEQDFVVESGHPSAGKWSLKHPGKAAIAPEWAASIERRARRLGLDQVCSFGYQWDDLIESRMGRTGDLLAWRMGLGKARAALALALLGGRYNLIVVEPYLIDEMVEEIAKVDLERRLRTRGQLRAGKRLYQVIRQPSDLDSLCRINLITYPRLRRPLGPGQRRTYAKALRRRLHTVIADEGSLLRNPDTAQSRALWALSPKRRYILDGTPTNYPKDLHPQLAWVHGDGTAAQPYGWHRSYLERRLLLGYQFAPRGIDRLRDDFITYEWVTREFCEKNRDAARREIPRIKHVGRYREWVAPLVKRRVHHEPDVAAHVRFPVPQRHVETVPWDASHLRFYLRVAEYFAQWYLRQRESAGHTRNGTNLVALLARIGAVRLAANAPSRPFGGDQAQSFGTYGAETSKERRAAELLLQWANAGDKTLGFVRNPQTAERLSRALAREGIESIVVHGGRPIRERTVAVNRRFRHGDCPVLLATYGTLARGMNLQIANRVLVYERRWSAAAEEQAVHRVVRPGQTRTPQVTYLHLQGSIDEYMAMLVAFKSDAERVGMDWGTPELDQEQFLHLDTILYRFCSDLAEQGGLSLQELKQRLLAA